MRIEKRAKERRRKKERKKEMKERRKEGRKAGRKEKKTKNEEFFCFLFLLQRKEKKVKILKIKYNIEEVWNIEEDSPWRL